MNLTSDLYNKTIVRAGDEYLNTPDDDATARNYKINTVKKHELYEQGVKYDIALVYTTEPIKFNDRTKKICIPQIPEEHNDSDAGHLVYLNGWGREDDWPDRINDSLKEAQIQLFSKNFCDDFYQDYDPSIHLCAGNQHGEVGTCPGDSGSPLVKLMSFTSPPFYMLVGVTHGSSDHCEDRRIDAPGIFARLKNENILKFVTEGKTLIDSLHQAAIEGNLDEVKEMTKFLINVNPVDNDGKTLLRNAHDNGKQKVVIFLLEELQNLGIETDETNEITETLGKFFYRV